MKLKSPSPEIILRNGKPSGVILDIDVYESMLERLEQKDDLAALAALRKKPVKFRPLKEFLAEYKPHA
ncbi:MAG: type II toxin-antitoxin system Phd/YefM family antitoxin [Phycisphaerae bacterium]